MLLRPGRQDAGRVRSGNGQGGRSPVQGRRSREEVSLRAPGKVLLVSCYELGHQPLSLASPLAALTEAGFAPRAVDTSVEPLDDGAIQAAQLVAISVPMHTAMRLAHDVAERIRHLNPTAHITFYGLYASLNATHLFESNLAASVIGGEFERPLVNLAQHIFCHSERSEESVPFRSLDVVGSSPAGVRFPDHDTPPALARQTLPVPRRETLPSLAHYAHFLRDGTPVLAGYVEATRGCKHTCTHCPITPVYGGRFFAVPRDTVLADVRAQVATGARHITFGDPDFLNGPTHSLKIARAMHAEFPDVTFDATIKVEHILQHPAIFPELRELGCAFIVSAVESLSDIVLAHLKKGHTAADVERALAIAANAGIPLRPSLVAFTPWTTLDDYLTLLHFVQTHALIDSIDPVQYAIRLLIPPGSAVLNDPDATRWLGELDSSAFSYRWTHPDARMDALHVQVSAIVQHDETEEHDAWQTFEAITAAAHQAAGLRPLAATPPPAERRPPPRLTETWFC